jgi:hypothetical protein
VLAARSVGKSCGDVVLVTHDRRILEAFAAGRTLELDAGECLRPEQSRREPDSPLRGSTR